MAQILVRLKPAPPKVEADPVLQERTGKRPGMIVFVADDAHVWGTEELGPKFGVLSLPRIPVASVLAFMEPEVEDDVDDPVFHAVDRPVKKVKRGRRWEFLVDEADVLFAALRNDLATKEKVIIKVRGMKGNEPFDYRWSDLKGFLKDHQTGLREDRNL